MKKFTKLFAVVMALALTAVMFAACGGSSSSDADSSDASSQAVESKAGDESSKGDESKVDNGSVDYDNPTVTIIDFETMETYAKEMQSNGHQGEVVKVTGINSRSNFGAKATISISDGGSTKKGTTYKIDGADSIDAYPENDAEIEITGVVTLEEGGIGCYIAVPADRVTVK